MRVPRTLAALAALLLPLLGLAAELNLTVSPRTLRLAEGGRATIRVATAGPAPIIRASAGRLEPAREVASGVYEAELIPPDAIDPQIVFVSAVSGADFTWQRLALAGTREVELRAAPRALVGVTVEGQEFGPNPADPTGRAVIRVDVPPGTHHATSRGQRIDLDVPVRSWADVVLDQVELEAGAQGKVAVRALVVDDRGAPLARVAPRLEASTGTLSRPREVAPGVWLAEWTVPPGRLEQSKVTASFPSRPPASASAVLRRVAGAPTAVEIDVDQGRLVAGEADELQVTSRVVDAAGNPTGAPARLVVSLGSGERARFLPDAVIDWQQTGDGFVGRVQAPRQRTGRTQLELKVIATGGLVGTKVVDLLPGPPALVRIEEEEELLADGKPRPIRVSVVDKFGNRADSTAPLQITAQRGRFGRPEQAGPGAYRVDYDPAVSARDYRDAVTARVGAAEGRGELWVRAPGGTVVVGAKGGVALATGGLSSPAFGAEVGFWSRQNLGLVLEARWARFGRNEDVQVGEQTFAVDAETTFAGLDASLAWRRPLLAGMLWLGAGGGFSRAGSTVSLAGQPDESAGSWVPAAHASLSWGLPIGPGIPFLELKGGWQGDPGEPVSGSFESLTISLGYRFDVF